MLLIGSEVGAHASLWPVPFSNAMAQLGWLVGKNLELVVRFANDDFDRLPALAAELVALDPEIILTHTSDGARAVAAATTSIPVIVGAASEEALLQLAGGFARPAGNITGFTVTSHEQHAKCVELLKQSLPAVTSIGVLVNPLVRSYGDYPAPLAKALAPLGLKFVRVEVNDIEDLGSAFAALSAAGVQAALVTASPNFNRTVMERRIGELAVVHKILVAGTFEGLAREGGFLVLATDYSSLIRRTATYVDKILRGAKPSELPVERPSVFKLVVNMKTATSLGLKISLDILSRADEVIE